MGDYEQDILARNSNVSVGTTSIVLSSIRFPTSPRRMIVVRNISPNATDTISISLGPNAAVADTGIVLKQFESFTDTTDNGYTSHQGFINAICATATGVVAITER